jgi:putative transposase
MYLPGVPAHVVDQRGVNRTTCFFTDADYRCYLTYLKKSLARYRVRLHAYVLMTNHVHLSMTPEDSTGISSVMALLGNHYVRHVNKSYGRTGGDAVEKVSHSGLFFLVSSAFVNAFLLK